MTIKQAAAAAGVAFLCAAAPAAAQDENKPAPSTAAPRFTIKDPGNLYPVMVIQGQEFRSSHFFVTACGMDPETKAPKQLVSQVYIGLPLASDAVRAVTPARQAEMLRELQEQVEAGFRASFAQSIRLTRTTQAAPGLFHNAVTSIRAGFFHESDINAGIAAAPPIPREGCGLPEGYDAQSFAADHDNFVNPPRKPGEPRNIQPGRSHDNEQSAGLRQSAPRPGLG